MDKSIYTLSFSVSLFFLLVAAYAGTLMSLSLASWPIGFVATLSLVVLIHFIFVLQRYVLFYDGVSRFSYDSSGVWELFYLDHWVKAKLMSDSILTGHLIILNFDLIDYKQSCSVVVLNDSLSSARRSQLCWDMLRSIRGKKKR